MKKQLLILLHLFFFFISFPVLSQNSGNHNYKISLKGKLLLAPNINEPLSSATIKIITEPESKMQTTETDIFGNFHFTNLDPERTYILIVASEDIEKVPDSLYLADKKGSIRKKSGVNESKYVFSLKPNEQNVFVERIYPDALAQMAESISKFFVNTSSVKVTGYLTDQNGNSLSRFQLILITPEGKRLYKTYTDTAGYFLFKNLPGHKKYQVRYDTKSSKLKPGSEILLKDASGKLILSTEVDEKGFFSFYELPIKTIKAEEDKIELVTLAGSVLVGKEFLKPLQGQTLHLINDKGEIVRVAETDSLGSFKFEHLPPDQKFQITIPHTDSKISPNNRVVITDNKGKIIYTTVADFKGGFNFEILTMEDSKLKLIAFEDDSELKIQVKGKIMEGKEGSLPLKNATVNLYNEKGELLQISKTDLNGNFKFINLPPDQNYLVLVEAKDTNLSQKYFLTDSQGKILKQLIFDKGAYKFEILQSDHPAMAVIYVEDPWLKIKEVKSMQKESVLIIENIYYDYGKANILDEGLKILNKVVNILNENHEIKIEILAYTDSRGNKDFNLELSQRRAKAVVEYIVSKGVDSKRVIGRGLGDSVLRNYCADGVECPEELHRQNRRTEFRVSM